MKKILIATHGTFASGAESTVRFLMGNVGNITCINAYVDQDENLVETLERYFAQIRPEDQVIVLTDIKGGSVNQKIVPYAVRENVFLVAGFNLPLLVALAIAPEGITKDGIKQYIEDSRNQMELVELDNQEGQDEDFFG
ncbi:PTS fructose transporter subunit IIA [Clostridiales bacterium TF09-2AC]|uniref:PTS fructose transporter subunit IIA n=1 Tax=Enterocloster hominis (ex Hitch et al. 2024) TaxID=1917870 RepID=A0ABV1D3Y2_9FIRM|nr:PTS fructose transporter subunit IIA [Lachnoclostridium pacaense]EEQ57355.1 PTS system fructose IIA component [Clostridiales bacterium 1_7_47FAA]MCC2816062.1 PTS fructose transporter subunit IIA [Lachnoclostridium pacaense]RJW48826.1 PTS fructose transporter subunit IIA [Clostridiales bacterium TF09-2AC]